MNPIIENILTRRSCRAYTDKPIPREDIEALLTCARYAPSANNRRLWKFTAVLDQALIQRLAKAVGAAVGADESYCFYHPAALIIPSSQEDYPYGREDNACALENIFLAAHSLGLGSVWINQAFGNCHNAEIRAVLAELGVPENHVVYGMAALGYPAGELPEPDKSADTAIVG
ncbi:MAG: nitroreductase family protein [Firmicutes bacterium]|nr:nitroreductase family protein [Bacillota bacterium]